MKRKEKKRNKIENKTKDLGDEKKNKTKQKTWVML